MLFHNPNTFPLGFTIRGKAYAVAPGAECEVPDAYAYAVHGMGVLLADGPAPRPRAPASAPEPAKAPAPAPAAPSVPAPVLTAAHATQDGRGRRG